MVTAGSRAGVPRDAEVLDAPTWGNSETAYGVGSKVEAFAGLFGTPWLVCNWNWELATLSMEAPWSVWSPRHERFCTYPSICSIPGFSQGRTTH